MSKLNSKLQAILDSMTQYGEQSIEANHSIMLAEQSKAELMEIARGKLVAMFGTDWHKLPTIDPELPHNKEKPKAVREFNTLRIALQAVQSARLVKKYGADSEGKPVRGNPDSAMSELRKAQKAVLAEPEQAKGKKAVADKKGARAKGRDANQVFADSVLAFADYVTRQTKKGLNGFEADTAPLVREFCKLIVKHGIKTRTTRK